jgi:putative chitinase
LTAALNRAVFFDHVRKPLFGGSLTPQQVQGMDAILDACPAALPTDPLAYCLATTLREAGPSMQPVHEEGRGRRRSYGRATGPYKQVYYGRGLVQLTWHANYVNATTKLRKLGLLKADEDLARTPDLALRPDIAAAILFHGMIEGWFTTKKLSNYFGHGKSNPHGARAIINGSDHASLIAGYFGHFRAALIAAKHGAAPGEPVTASMPPAASVAPAKPKPLSDKHAVVSKPAVVKKRTAAVAHVTHRAKHR